MKSRALRRLFFRAGRGRRPSGFALIATLSMMVLLLVAAVALLSLSSISLRASGAMEPQRRAEANARLALMMAIGELQNLMGPDQRISARASSLGSTVKQPEMLGAWRSWRWDPEREDGPDYSAKKEGFLGWLASVEQMEDRLSPQLPQRDFKDQVWLMKPDLTSGTQGLAASRVSVGGKGARQGGYAWAVMDESQKAPIRLPETEPMSDGEIIARRTAPERARPEAVVAKLSPDALGDLAKIVSLQTASLAISDTGREIRNRETDLTSHSVGLLTDVVAGGFKTDLTQLFESDVLLSDHFGRESPYFYPANGAPTWEYLRDHYKLYRKTREAATGRPVVALGSNDLTPANVGLRTAPVKERLLPVISKLQIMFSVVSHHARIQPRVDVYNSAPTRPYPRGNAYYAVPMLVYDPVVTLYNPYDVALELQNLRVRISDPPVLFGFKKNDVWLRREFAQNPLGAGFHSLARFQIKHESNPSARRTFTLILGDGSGDSFGTSIRLEPGELKAFSPRVESRWTWGFETDEGGHYKGRTFFDWEAEMEFGNKDGRGGPKSEFGVQSVPGWDPRAGFQVDHLSYGNGQRDPATLYSWEGAFRGDGWVGIYTGVEGSSFYPQSDTFTACATAGRAFRTTTEADFTMDVLAGVNIEPTSDYLRSFRFRFQNPSAEINGNLANSVVQRTFRVGEILQAERDPTTGGKSPFALLTVSAKTTIDKAQAMPWLHNHPVVEGADQNSSQIGNALDVYDVRVDAATDFTSFPGIEIEPGSNRGFFGASTTANRGATHVPMFRVPLIPAASLGDLIPANLCPSQVPPRVTHPLGNSWGHPLIPADGIKTGATVSEDTLRLSAKTTEILDHSYLLNDAMWDRFFFSTLMDYPAGLLREEKKSDLMERFFLGGGKLLNRRLCPMPGGTTAFDGLVGRLEKQDAVELSETLGSKMAVDGPFNVNSDSVDAWVAVLASLRGEEVLGWQNSRMGVNGKTSFPRMSLSIAGDGEGSTAGLDVAGQRRWAGFRSLDDRQIRDLAERIVEEIRLRGEEDGAPCLSLAEFVNRRVGAARNLHVVKGLLETAIEKSGINDSYHARDSVKVDGRNAHSPADLQGLKFPEVRDGFSGEGAPSMVTQGDLLMALAPVVTVRGDTFRIRAYGDAKDANGRVTARAWCEAVVQRQPDFVDATDLPETALADLKSEANRLFGRRFVVTSFRWLTPEEV